MFADAEAEAPAALSLQELRNSAELLEREAVAAGRVTDTELDARRPAADVAAARLASAWFAYCCWLAERKGGAAAQGSRPLAQALHESLADEPVRVKLRSGHEVRVHAKSLNTLLVLEGIDAEVRRIAALLAEARYPDDAGDEALSSAVLVERLIVGQALRRFVWILDHEGPGLPFDDDATQAEPPEWTLQLSAEDVEAIWLAHLQVNRRDIEFLAAAFPAESRGQHSRLPLSGFLGAQAGEDGVAPKVYLFDRSLREIFAGCIARAETHRQAMADAKRDGGAR